MKRFAFAFALIPLVLLQTLFAMELTTETPFGHGMLQHFLVEKGFVNLNHGSFGTPPKMVIESEHKWQYQMEANPDRWFRYEMNGELDKVREQLASYVHVKAKDVVFVLNASTGVNAVLRSLKFSPSGKILYFDFAYPMVKNTIKFLNKQFGVESVQVNITFPTSSEDIITSARKALEANPGVEIAVFSHITSIPALILPVKELAEECHKHGAKVLIDGAHAIGQIPLDVSSLGVDFYISNCHKWLFSPRGSAFLWVKEEWQPLIYPTVISGAEGDNYFQTSFSWEGTADKSSFLAISAGLEFHKALGEERIFKHIHTLAVEGGKMLASMWNTELLVSEEMTAAMVNVRLPVASNSTAVDTLTDRLLKDYRTFIPIFSLQGKWYVRVSAQIYNEMSDFRHLGDSVLAILKE